MPKPIPGSVMGIRGLSLQLWGSVVESTVTPEPQPSSGHGLGYEGLKRKLSEKVPLGLDAIL